jgi:hypothetical protein
LNTGLRQNVGLGYLISAAFFFITAVLVPGTALGDILSVYATDNFTTGTLKTTDQNGTESKLNIENINQLYNIYMNKNLFPNLVFDLGGQFGRNNSVIKGGGSALHSEENQYNLFTDVKLDVKPFSSSVGYYKRTDSSTSLGSTLANTDERYNFLFDWRPEPGLPSLDLNYSKDFNYDGRRLITDTSTDQLLLDLKDAPLKTVALSYDLNYIDGFDNLRGTESVLTTHSGRITYDDSFFKHRVNVAATYDIASQSVDTIGRKGLNSAVQLQLFPVHGLSGISDITTTNTPAMITLNENPALIDGGLAASAGINLGFNSGLVTVPAPPRQEWNIGLDFVTPTQLTSLTIWVDKDLSKIPDLFHWAIYTSNDNINWTKRFTVTAAPSDFSTLPLPHFIIHFPSAITPRFVKAVVKPLDSVDQTTIIVRGLTPASFNDIAVTELQAFIVKTATTSQAKISASEFSQHLDVTGRAKLLEKRDLFYDLSLFLANSSSSGGGAAQTNAFLSNGLTFNQKFGGIYTVNARAARNDNYLRLGHSTEYQYSAALSATPLATLSDAILYSGHYTTNPPLGNTSSTGTTNIQNSFFLYNTAILYPGINGLLNGGYTFGTLESGQSNQTMQGNVGLNLVPNPRMNMNLNYSITSSSLSGGNKRATSLTTYNALASATLTPVSALYLFASIQLSKTTTIQTLTNYGLNFSPFPGGELQFHFNYNETLGPETGEKTRTITPSLRWNIRPGATLDVTYQMQQSNLAALKTDSKILSSSLQVTF